VLLLVHRFLSPWWRRRQVHPKRRFLQEPHGVTTQKTPFFLVRKMAHDHAHYHHSHPHLLYLVDQNRCLHTIIYMGLLNGTCRSDDNSISITVLWICRHIMWQIDTKASDENRDDRLLWNFCIYPIIQRSIPGGRNFNIRILFVIFVDACNCCVQQCLLTLPTTICQPFYYQNIQWYVM
jgi:hypothetical protein